MLRPNIWSARVCNWLRRDVNWTKRITRSRANISFLCSPSCFNAVWKSTNLIALGERNGWENSYTRENLIFQFAITDAADCKRSFLLIGIGKHYELTAHLALFFCFMRKNVCSKWKFGQFGIALMTYLLLFKCFDLLKTHQYLIELITQTKNVDIRTHKNT